MGRRSERKLYDEPKLLVAAGFATATREFTGQRPRTLYTITDAGREALRRWLDEPSAPRVSEFEAMVKVFFADAGSLDQLRSTVDGIEASARDRVAALGQLVDRSLTEGPVFPERRHLSALTLRLQLAQETAVIDWTAWARKQLSCWSSTTQPASWDDRAALTELRGQIRATLEAR